MDATVWTVPAEKILVSIIKIYISINMIYDTSIGIGCSNNGALFNKCELQQCTNYTFNKLTQ